MQRKACARLFAAWRIWRPPYSGAKALTLLALVTGPARRSHNRSQFRRSGGVEDASAKRLACGGGPK
jgi:hypothetical protein